MSSSGELPSALSSAGPSSPNSNYNDNKNNSDSNWSKTASRALPAWDAAPAGPRAPPAAGSSISGDVTPVSGTSELEFNSNEATAGSITDHDILSGEGEDDEETLSADACGSPLKIIKNDLSPQACSHSAAKFDGGHASTSNVPVELYGLSLQQTKEAFYKDMPSSSKNFNLDCEIKNKCSKKHRAHSYLSNLDTLNLQNKECRGGSKKNEVLNNGSRRYSDSSAQKSNLNTQPIGSRFKTTLVVEDNLTPSTSSETTPNNTVPEAADEQSPADPKPLLTKALSTSVKPGFTISES
ncbi:uncharacterized protein [Epargyreus clarus]|uniref:uncharacterized protein isoform X2 n=1 Tax=Epargyreus clarus TaxID=520877 RepID=UPI003C2E3F9E